MASDFVRFTSEIETIYATSAKVLPTLNHQPQTEPDSADEVSA
jgi:hypothetical protein